MGRFAYFTGDGGEGEEDSYEYKFWVAIQNSKVPWAKYSIQYSVMEYDESDADYMEMSEYKRKLWQKYEDQTFTNELPEEVKIHLSSCVRTENIAEDKVTEKELAHRWKMVNALARKLKQPLFKDVFEQNKAGYSTDDSDNKKRLKTLEYYQEEILWKVDVDLKEETREFAEKLADLNLVTVICVLLQNWKGELWCQFET